MKRLLSILMAAIVAMVAAVIAIAMAYRKFIQVLNEVSPILPHLIHKFLNTSQIGAGKDGRSVVVDRRR